MPPARVINQSELLPNDTWPYVGISQVFLFSENHSLQSLVWNASKQESAHTGHVYFKTIHNIPSQRRREQTRPEPFPLHDRVLGSWLQGSLESHWRKRDNAAELNGNAEEKYT